MSDQHPIAREATPSSYESYLEAKRTVDDRALNQHVVGVLRQALRERAHASRVLDLGAGHGAMVARLADWGVLTRADYTLLDANRALLDAAPGRLRGWAEASHRALERAGESVRIRGGDPDVDLTVRFACAELNDFLCAPGDREQFDLLIGNAFLDLVDVPASLPALFARLGVNGLFWFSINFDGETIFLPEHEQDAALMRIYHRSMDDRLRRGERAGDSRTGRHLFTHLRAAGATILGAGSSDWVVHATDGAYPASEHVFLESILRTIDAELNWRSEVDGAHLRDWLLSRRDQLARGELVYIAHQLDFVGRRPAARR